MDVIAENIKELKKSPEFTQLNASAITEILEYVAKKNIPFWRIQSYLNICAVNLSVTMSAFKKTFIYKKIGKTWENMNDVPCEMVSVTCITITSC